MRTPFYHSLTFCVLFNVLFLLDVSSTYANERDQYSEEIEQSREQLKSLNQSLKLDKNQQIEIRQQLENHDRQIQRLDRKMNALRQQIANHSQKLKALESDLVIQTTNNTTSKRLARGADQYILSNGQAVQYPVTTQSR